MKSRFYQLNQLAAWFAGLSILGMTLLGGADMFSTLLFHKPVHAVFEATQTLMVMVVFLGLGLVHLNRAHICVDVGYDLMPRPMKRISDLLSLLFLGVFFGALAWRGWQAAVHSYAIGEYSPGIIAFPLYPAKFALAIGATLGVACVVHDLLLGGVFRQKKAHKDLDLAEMSLKG